MDGGGEGFGAKNERRKGKREEGRKEKCLSLLHKQIPTRNHRVECETVEYVLYPGIAVNSDAKPNTQIQRKMPTADQERFTQTFISLSSLPITSKNLTSFSPYNA